MTYKPEWIEALQPQASEETHTYGPYRPRPHGLIAAIRSVPEMLRQASGLPPLYLRAPQGGAGLQARPAVPVRASFDAMDREFGHARPEPGETEFGQLIALLQARANGAGGGGGGMAMPSLNDYLSPYNQAEQAARAANDAAVGSITSNYDRLRQQIGANTAAYQAKAAELSAAQNQNAQGLRAEASQLLDTGAPGSSPQAQAVARQQQARLAQQQAAAADLKQDQASSQAAGRASALDQVGGSQAAALNQTASNLSALLNRLNLGKADAQQRFRQDSAEASRFNAQAASASQADRINALQSIMELKQQQQDRLSAGTTGKAGSTKTPSGRDFVLSSMAELSKKYPTTMEVAADIMGAAKNDPMAAFSALEAMTPSLRAGVDADGNKFNKFDQTALDRLRNILALYYTSDTGVANGLGGL